MSINEQQCDLRRPTENPADANMNTSSAMAVVAPRLRQEMEKAERSLRSS